MRSERGFTLLELMFATTIMLVVTASIFSLLDPAHGAFKAQPEVADMQQRLRVGADALYKDLVMAGAGVYQGAKAGTLGNFFASILPYRLGRINKDLPGTFKTDTVTLVYIPNTASQTSISSQMPATSAELKVNAEPGCPSTDPLCGFTQGMNVLIFDDTGSYDTFTVTQVQDPAVKLQHNMDDMNKQYTAGAKISQVITHTYYLKKDTVNLANPNDQLMLYDGAATETPVIDHLVALQFDYYGEPSPPQLRKPVSDPVGPWTTYGPKPPSLGVQNGNWPLGENCVFQKDPVSGMQVPRLATLGAASGALVQLTANDLNSGPWCADNQDPNGFDADLLRIRKIRVRIRIQSALAALRGPAGALFVHGGTAPGGSRYLPDHEIQFEVSPRNLNLGR